jgi:tetratricopeptide (TPR) repeat protein
VVVANTGSGHGWPAFGEEAWVELELRDSSGSVSASRGAPDPSGNPASGAHRIGLGGIDRDGNPITQDNKHQAIAWLGPRDRNIAPGAADVARYRIALPPTAVDLTITARIWRRSNKNKTEILASASSSLMNPILPVHSANPTPKDWTAYGIGLMGREEWRAARQAFEKVDETSAGRGMVGSLMGRAHLGEGDLLAARSAFQRAATAFDNRDSALAWLGHTHRLMGQYDEALRILRPLASAYPKDRQTWFDLGRSLFQLGRLEEAIDAYQKALAIDPDDASARFNLMLAYRSLRKMTDARREEAIYAVIGEDDQPEKLLETYRRAHPAEALESLPGHVHSLRVTIK